MGQKQLQQIGGNILADLWFEAHQTICRHPKTLKLARLLNIKRREAVGLLVDLFSWGIDIAGKCGELPGLTSEDIAAALDYTPKNAEKVASALVESGYMELQDGQYSIHDWYDYAGKLYDFREKNREKNKRYRDNKKSTSHSNKDSNVTVTRRLDDQATVPNLTEPNIDDNNNSVCAYAGGRAREGDPELARVMSAYMDRINPTPSPVSLDELKEFVKMLGADVVIRAFDMALDEHKTSWSYIRAILRNYVSQGVRCLADIQRLQDERDARRVTSDEKAQDRSRYEDAM